MSQNGDKIVDFLSRKFDIFSPRQVRKDKLCFFFVFFFVFMTKREHSIGIYPRSELLYGYPCFRYISLLSSNDFHISYHPCNLVLKNWKDRIASLVILTTQVFNLQTFKDDSLKH
jgi:hypothetical protein